MSKSAEGPSSGVVDALPVIIVTGFLGSGKTSFLSTILKLQEMSNSAVIINEFGEFALDHLLVDYAEHQTFDLPNGCLCCSARGELVEKMLTLFEQRSHGLVDFERLIIETSGVADAPNLIETLWADRQIRDRFKLAKIITVISAVEWSEEWSNNTGTDDEANNQLAISDTVIVSKSDLLAQKTRDEQLAHLQAAMEMINGSANYYFTPLANEPLRQIIDLSPETSQQTRSAIASPRTNETTTVHNITAFKTCTLSHDSPLAKQTIDLFIDILLGRHAQSLLRVKGLVATIENPDQPLVIQAVKSTRSPDTWLKQWSGPRQTRLTLIHRGHSNEKFIDLFNSLDIPAIDRPDKKALSDNPLSITGLGGFKPQ